jgi:NDP-4-keto-2,6-dideoxyhexose 3-C-methyltransferase
MYNGIERCRICGNADLRLVLDLGVQVLTGVFPQTRDQKVTAGPLMLVKCTGGAEVCGLLQLRHSYDLSEMYGRNYGYRSGLNASMVQHLRGKVRDIQRRVSLQPGALVIDIGSNDSTTLQAYPDQDFTLVGIDPTGAKFQSFYPSHINLIPDFFSSAKVKEQYGSRKAMVITSFSMFYDLEDPLAFMREIAEVLDDEGIWVFEQSYMPTMLDNNSYDTVCHEHLEYYALKQIDWMARKAGLKIIDVEFNDVNGGSFSVVAAKAAASFAPSVAVSAAHQAEANKGLESLEIYHAFAGRAEQSRQQLLEFLDKATRVGQRVYGLGASTKGNVLLQYCRITEAQVGKVAEVNTEKFGCFTPGTLLPIVPQALAFAEKPDYLLVLPWHFRDFFLNSPTFAAQKLLFPLPGIDVVVR